MNKVLIIEDDEVIAEVFKDKLQAEGYEVEVRHDGQGGYLRLQTFEPDLLLLDMMVPRLAGVDILRKLRGRKEYQDLPIIAFSGSDDLLDDAKVLGATRVLSKAEYMPNQIVARITEVLAARPKPGQIKDMFVTEINEWLPALGRVLIVEDDAVMMQLVKDVVEDEGYSVVCAADGGEAYRILEQDNKFVAGIFDVMIPALRGTELLRHMQTEKRLLKIPVLIMSNCQDVTLRTESLSAGALVFLPKPFTRAALRAMFRTLISARISKPKPPTQLQAYFN